MRPVTADTLRRSLGCQFIIGGSSALAHAGWTTQIQQMPEVLTREGVCDAIPGVRVRPRAAAVFDRLRGSLSWDGYGEEELPVLLPEMAIADAFLDRRSGGQTHIYDPDDLDPDGIGAGACGRLRSALSILGAPDSLAQACLDRYSPVLSGAASPHFR